MYCSFSVTLLQLSESHSSDYEERKTFEKTEMNRSFEITVFFINNGFVDHALSP